MKNIFILGICMCMSSGAFAMEQAAADSVKRDDSLKIRRIGLFSEKTAPDWFSELGRTEVITRQDIESCPVQTLEGVLSRVPGISIRRYGPMGSLGQVNVRGGEGNTVAIFVNGQRINSMLRSIYTLDNIPVSLDMIESIEVRLGGDSQRFGEFATDGVINIITRADLKNSGMMVDAYGGSLTSYGGSVTGALNKRKFDLTANVSGSNVQDEDDEHSDVKTYLQTSYGIAPWVKLVADGSFVYNKYQAPFLFGSNTATEMDNTYNFKGSAGFRFPISNKLNLFALYSYSNFKEQYDPFDMRDTPLDDPYAQYKLNKVQYTRYRNSVIDFGGSYRARMVDVYFGFNHTSSYFESSNILGDPLDYWKKVPGKPYNFYRYYGSRDTWRLYYDMSLKFKKWYLNAGLSMNGSGEYGTLTFGYGGELGFNIAKGFKAFMSLNRSFRNATFFEQYVYDDNFHGDSELENELVMAWNAGIKYRNDYSAFRLTAYTQSRKEAIVMQKYENSTYFSFANYSTSNIAVRGFEAGYDINIDKLTKGVIPVTNLSLGYAYNTNNLDAYSLLTNNYMEHNAQAALTVKLFKNLYIDADYALQHRANSHLVLESTDTVGYKWNSLLDAAVTWKAPSDRFWIYVRAQNLLNQKFYDVSYIRTNPGASFVAGVKYNFLLGRKKKY